MVDAWCKWTLNQQWFTHRPLPAYIQKLHLNGGLKLEFKQETGTGTEVYKMHTSVSPIMVDPVSLR